MQYFPHSPGMIDAKYHKGLIDQALCHENRSTLLGTAMKLTAEALDSEFVSCIRAHPEERHGNRVFQVRELHTSDDDLAQKLSPELIPFLEKRLPLHPQVNRLLQGQTAQFEVLDLTGSSWRERYIWLWHFYDPINPGLRFSGVFPIARYSDGGFSAVTLLRSGTVGFEPKDYKIANLLAGIFQEAEGFLGLWSHLEVFYKWLWLHASEKASVLAGQMCCSARTVEFHRRKLFQMLREYHLEGTAAEIIARNLARINPSERIRLEYSQPKDLDFPQHSLAD